ncbi:MAG: LuxR family transcriptional regulator [Sphingomonadaceae bacterium]|nr:LuxR family transcriptional regulator [Sphingomonadaceae bacterium]
MSLSRVDDDELLKALHSGRDDTPPWNDFLNRTRAYTRAESAVFLIAAGEDSLVRATQHWCGIVQEEAVTSIPFARMHPARAYVTEELIADPAMGSARLPALHLCAIRFLDRSGTNGCVVLIRTGSAFGVSERALLTRLAPHLAIALRNVAELERARLRAGVAEDLLRRAGVIWGVIGTDGSQLAGPRPTTLSWPSGEAERRVARLGREACMKPVTRPAAVRLGDEADIRLLALPSPLKSEALSDPAFVAIGRVRPVANPDQAAALAALNGLSATEAQLALMMADGQTIAEAGKALGLTLETARNYSKRLYVKTGTRGQGDLVRYVLSSVAMFA